MSIAKNLLELLETSDSKKWVTLDDIDCCCDVMISKRGDKHDGKYGKIIKEMGAKVDSNPSIRVKLKDSGEVVHYTRQNLRAVK